MRYFFVFPLISAGRSWGVFSRAAQGKSFWAHFLQGKMEKIAREMRKKYFWVCFFRKEIFFFRKVCFNFWPAFFLTGFLRFEGNAPHMFDVAACDLRTLSFCNLFIFCHLCTFVLSQPAISGAITVLMCYMAGPFFAVKSTSLLFH